MNKRFGVILSLFLAVPGAVSAERAERLSLDAVLKAVDSENPALRAAREAAGAARARVAPAKAWPNPELSYSREEMPGGEELDRFGVEQEIPFPGKLSAEGATAQHEARIAEADYRAKRLAALAEARVLYYRLFRADELVERFSRDLEVMKSAVRVAQARLSSGKAAPGEAMAGSGGADAFSLMAETGRMENMLHAERQGRELIAIELNTLMNRDVSAPVGRAAAPRLADVPVTRDEALRLARENDPNYRRAMHEEAHARAMRLRAGLGFAPDFGVGYQRISAMDGSTGSEFGVRASLPFWLTSPAGRLREARAHERETRAAAEAMRLESVKMAAMEHNETNTHLTLARNLRDVVVPSAQSAFKLARSQYESGGGSFVRLLETVRTHIAVQKEYYDELYHYGEHWALLERWIGVPLDPEEKSHE